MAYDRDTVDALVDDTGDDLSGTVLSESQFDAIIDDLEKGWHLAKADAQPYVRGNDTTGAIDFGAGGATAPDVALKRTASGVLAARNVADSAYQKIEASGFKISTTEIIDNQGNVTPAGSAPVAPGVSTLYKDNICKAWVSFNGTGTIAILDDYNVSGLVDVGTGDYTITIDTNLADGNYAPVGMANRNGTSTGVDLRLVHVSEAVSPAVGSFNLQVVDSVNALADAARISVIVFGGV